jgi:hypothetical protein
MDDTIPVRGLRRAVSDMTAEDEALLCFRLLYNA